MNTKLSGFLKQHLNYYLSLLHQMVEINSYTMNSTGVNQLGKLTARIFSGLGFVTEFVPSSNPNFGKHLFLRQYSNHFAGNPVNRIPHIAMISHLDTVFSPEEEKANDFHYRPEGNRIYGPATVDIKGGTLMIYMVLDALRSLFPEIFDNTNWIIGLNASEERLSDDFGALCVHRFPKNTRACLVFEGGTPNQDSYPIVISRKGMAVFRVAAEGRGAHSGNYHKQGANAILQLSDTVGKIARFTDYTKQITFNVGVINGGSVVNRVPQSAEALVEMRAFTPEVFEEGLKKMVALDNSSTVSSYDGFPCKISIHKLSSTAPWPRNSTTESLFEVWREVGRELALNIIPEERGGLSDGNLLWHDFPVLDGLGPSGVNAHCSERSSDGAKEQEYVLVDSFVPKAMLNINSILSLLDQPAE